MKSHKNLKIYKPYFHEEMTLPVFVSSIQAGFPSPAEDYIEHELDLNQLLIQHPSATFFIRVEGESMKGMIHSGDILVVDRAIQPTNGKIVVAVLNGEFTVKRFIHEGEKPLLVPENPDFPTIVIEESEDFYIWGVVTFVIHRAV